MIEFKNIDPSYFKEIETVAANNLMDRYYIEGNLNDNVMIHVDGSIKIDDINYCVDYIILEWNALNVWESDLTIKMIDDYDKHKDLVKYYYNNCDF